MCTPYKYSPPLRPCNNSLFCCSRLLEVYQSSASVYCNAALIVLQQVRKPKVQSSSAIWIIFSVIIHRTTSHYSQIFVESFGDDNVFYYWSCVDLFRFFRFVDEADGPLKKIFILHSIHDCDIYWVRNPVIFMFYI